MNEILVEINTAKRSSLIDIEKLLSIIFVVWTHFLKGSIIFLHLIHMPMFFSISGYFFYEEILNYSFIDFCKRKIYRLLIPYFIWSCISYIFNIFISKNYTTNFLIEEFLSIFIYARSLWFFIALFVLLIMMRVCYEVSFRTKIPFIFCMLIFYIFIYFVPKDNIFAFYKIKEFSLFFILGYFLKYKRIQDKKIFDFDYRYLLLFFVLLFLIIKFAFKLELPEEKFVYSTLTNNIFWLLGCFFGLLFCIGLASFFYQFSFIKNKISYFGRYSIDIYVGHMFFVKIFNILLKKFNLGIFKDFYLLVLSIFVTLVIIFLSEKFLRKIKLYRISIGEK